MSYQKRTLRQRTDKRLSQYEPKVIKERGLLGNDAGTVSTGTGRYVYVRLLTGETIQAYNDQTPNTPDMLVEVVYKNRRWRVVGASDTYAEPVYSGTPDHADTHQWPAQDTLWVEGQQFLPGLVSAYSGMTVRVYGGSLHTSGGWVKAITQDVNLTAYIPTSGAKWALLEWDSTGAVSVTMGATVGTRAQLVPSNIPAPTGAYQLAAIRMYNGQTAVVQSSVQNDILDLRWGYNTAPILSGPIVDYIDFNTSPTVTDQEGRLVWNSTDGTLQIGLPGGNVVNQIGQELLIPRRVKNTSGSPMYNGQLVYISGGDGNNAYVALAKADAEATSATTIAMLTEDIASGQRGYATMLGLVRGTTGQPIDTSAYAPGTLLYLSPTTAGGFTSTKPTAPNHLVTIGQVFRQHASEGAILVKIDNGYELDELHDVLISGLAADDILQYNGTTWANITMAALAADLPIPSGATLPASPLANQLFMHTPTGRRVLMLYTNSAWTPVYSFGTMTVYVDGALGTDSADLGYGTGANAWKTLSYAWTQIAGTYFGNVTINVAAGTYSETLTCQGKMAGGAYSVTIVGAESSAIDSGTMTSGVQGTGATPGSITDTTKAWTADVYRGKFVKVGSTIRAIKSNTADTLYIASVFASAPSGAYSIIEPDTVIDGGATRSFAVVIADGQAVQFRLLKITNSTVIDVYINERSRSVFTNCQFAPANGKQIIFQQSAWARVEYCAFIHDGTTSYNNMNGHSTFVTWGCVYYQKTGIKSGFAFLPVASFVTFGIGNSLSNFSTAVSASGNALVNWSASSGYNFVTDNTTGLAAATGAQQINTANNQYSGNTTNESSVTATFGAVGTPSQYLFTGDLFVDGNADEVQLTVQGNSSQTANLFVIENSSGTDYFNVSALGAAALNYGASTYAAGISRILDIQASAAGDAGGTSDVRALSFTLYATGSNNVSSLAAIQGDVYAQMTAGTLGAVATASTALRHTGAGAVTSAYGYRSIPILSSTGSIGTYTHFEARAPSIGSTGGITTIYGAWIRNQGNAKVTNAYGLYIDSQANAATLNYAIYTNSGAVRFGDTVQSTGRKRAVVTKTGNYTATANDEVIICNSATAMTITLPQATGSGQTYAIKSINNGAVTIDGNAAETIDGQTTIILGKYDSAQITDYGTGVWAII